MKAMRHTRVFLAVATTLLISACGKEDVPEPDNIAPTLTVSQTNSTNEMETLSIEFLGADVNESTGEAIASSSLSYSLYNTDGKKIGESPLAYGEVSINTETSSVEYQAPLVRTGDSISESFVLRVTDTGGLFAEQTVLVTTNDINDPVDVTVLVPQGAYGYENTKKDSEINFWYAENQTSGETFLSIVFAIDEKDYDELLVDYSVTEGLVFENQVITEMEGDNVTLKIPTPSITTPSEDFTVSLTVSDGDETVTSFANVTIVNKPSLAWEASSPMSISESSGGQIKFTTSEESSYSGEYSYKLTDENGDPLSFELPVVFDRDSGTLTFSESSGIQGDKLVKASVYLTSTITHAGGESYNEITELTRTLTVKDDRDDDFTLSTEEFEELRERMELSYERLDENRLAKTYGQYLFLNRLINKSEFNELEGAVDFELKKNIAELKEKAAEVRIAIDSNASNLYSLMNEFASDANDFGKSARVKLVETIESYNISFPETISKPQLLPLVTGGGYEVGEQFSHYVGNTSYGSYRDQDDTDWEFSANFAYMGVVDFYSATTYQTTYGL